MKKKSCLDCSYIYIYIKQNSLSLKSINFTIFFPLASTNTLQINIFYNLNPSGQMSCINTNSALISVPILPLFVIGLLTAIIYHRFPYFHYLLSLSLLPVFFFGFSTAFICYWFLYCFYCYRFPYSQYLLSVSILSLFVIDSQFQLVSVPIFPLFVIGF